RPPGRDRRRPRDDAGPGTLRRDREYRRRPDDPVQPRVARAPESADDRRGRVSSVGAAARARAAGAHAAPLSLPVDHVSPIPDRAHQRRFRERRSGQGHPHRADLHARSHPVLSRGGLLAVVLLLLSAAHSLAADCQSPKVVVTTVIGTRFCVDPAFDPVVRAQIQKIREDVRAERQSGKLIVYASTPISPRGGGHVATNLAIAAAVKARIEKEYGAAVWGRDPRRCQMGAGKGGQPGGGGEMGTGNARAPRGG